MSVGSKHARFAYPVVILAVLFSSLSALLIRLNAAPPLAIAAGRMAFSTAMVVPILTLRRARSYRRQGEASSAEAGPRVKPTLLMLLAGALLALHFATWITSLSMTSVTHATVLVTMHPLVVLVINAVFLRHGSGRRRLAGALGAVAGAVVLSLGGSAAGREPTLEGNLLAFTGAVAIAGYLVIGGRLRRSMDAWSYSLRVYGISAAGLVALALLRGVPLTGYPARDVMLVVLLALLCTILGHGLINWGLRYVSAADVSMLILLEPIFATVMAMVVLAEVPGPLSAVGAFLVVGSLALVSRRPA